MDEFARLQAKMKQAYEAEKYFEMLRLLDRMERRKGLSPDAIWGIHLARGMAQFELGATEEAVAAFRAALEGGTNASIESRRRLMSNYLMYLHYLSDVPMEKMRAAHFAYAGLFPSIRPFVHEKREEKARLRIGYLSPNLTDHIVLSFAVQLFAQYDRTRYEVVLYSTGERKNEVTEWIAGFVNGFRDISALSPEDAAREIQEDGVDILFDLAGHSEGGRTLEIAAYKPAPIQLCGIGYFDTTGLPAMDAFLGDVYCDPEGADAQFSETLLRLPQSHFCFTPTEQLAHFAGAYRLHSPIVFGSFNNFAKITDEMLVAWKEILARVPGSRLVLKNVKRQKEPVRYMEKRLRRLDLPQERIEVRCATRDYLREYLDVDILLDTYPYVGGGTTCEALYMGVPVVTRYGARHGSRFGLGLLENIGVGELAAPTAEAYIERAVMLANSPDLVAALHANLRQMMEQSPVMDGKGYTRSVEAAFEMLWEEWLHGGKREEG